ncbi:MAG: hypothetical protein IAE79_24945 [Anaerolinea sp.]|nr:hypothetical protein [Anaerolinea sp.]
MKQKDGVFIASLFLILALLLAACGEKNEEPAVGSSADAAAPAAANPAANFQTARSEELGVAVGHPTDWTAVVDEFGDIQMASDPALLEEGADELFRGALVAITSFDAEMIAFLDDSADPADPVSVLNTFSALVMNDDNVTFATTQAAAAMTVDGKQGARMALSMTGEQGKGMAYLTAVLDGPRIVYIFGAAEESVAGFADTYTAMLGTLKLTTPAATAPAVEAVAAAPVAEATSVPTAPSEPTPIPEPEPTAVPAPGYVSIDVDPGFYLYTSGDFIRDMTLHEGKVWVASLGGVLAWDVASGAARKYTTLDGLPHVGIYGITACPVPEMTLLAGTEDGLAAYDPASDSWYPATELFATEVVQGLFGVSGDKVGALLCDAANNRLIMEYKGVTTLNVMDGSTRTVPSSDLSWSGVRRMTLIGDQIWVSSGYRGYTIIDEAGVRPFSKNADTFDADAIYHIAAAPDGDVWMAASEGLLQVRNGQTIATFNRDNTANFSTPYYVAFDPAGAMWLGMSGRICQFDPASSECKANYSANQIDAMPFGEVSKILFDEAGHLYYHVFEGGWSYFDGSDWQRFQDNDLPIHAVQTLFNDGQGHVWMLGGTVYTVRTDLEMKQGWERFRDMGGDDMTVDAAGGIWLATGRNLYHYDGFQIVRRTKDDGLLDSYARTVAVADDGRIWIGQEDGLSIWDGQAFTTITTAADGWPAGRIQTLLLDGDVVWAGTDKGLIRYENGVSELALHGDVVGLPSPVIYALAKLTDGRLLVGTSRGLVYYDYAGRSITAEPAMTAWVTDIAVSQEGKIFVTSADDQGGGLYILDEAGWLHLTTADGLPTNRMRAVIIDSAGTLWVGGGYWGDGGGLVRLVP